MDLRILGEEIADLLRERLAADPAMRGDPDQLRNSWRRHRSARQPELICRGAARRPPDLRQMPWNRRRPLAVCRADRHARMAYPLGQLLSAAAPAPCWPTKARPWTAWPASCAASWSSALRTDSSPAEIHLGGYRPIGQPPGHRAQGERTTWPALLHRLRAAARWRLIRCPPPQPLSAALLSSERGPTNTSASFSTPAELRCRAPALPAGAGLPVRVGRAAARAGTAARLRGRRRRRRATLLTVGAPEPLREAPFPPSYRQQFSGPRPYWAGMLLNAIDLLLLAVAAVGGPARMGAWLPVLRARPGDTGTPACSPLSSTIAKSPGWWRRPRLLGIWIAPLSYVAIFLLVHVILGGAVPAPRAAPAGAGAQQHRQQAARNLPRCDQRGDARRRVVAVLLPDAAARPARGRLGARKRAGAAVCRARRMGRSAARPGPRACCGADPAKP